MRFSTAFALATIGSSAQAATQVGYFKNELNIQFWGYRIGNPALMLASTSIEEDIRINYCEIKNCSPNRVPIKTGGGTVVVDGFEGEMAKADGGISLSQATELEFVWSPVGKQELTMPKNSVGVFSLTRNSNYMKKMVEAGYITSNVFYVTKTNSAAITMGEISTKENKDGLDFIWFPQDHPMPNMWGFSTYGVTGVSYGQGSSRRPSWTYEYNYDGFVYPAYVDIGYSFIAAPTQVAVDLINHQIHGKRAMYNKDEKLTLVKCSDTFYNIQLTIDGKSYDVSKNKLVRKLDKTVSGYNCFIAIQPNDKDVWVMGTPFISNFVTAFDNSDPNNARFGIQQTKNHESVLDKPTDVAAYAKNILEVQKDIGKSTQTLTKHVKYSELYDGAPILENTDLSTVSSFFVERSDVGFGDATSADGSNGHHGKGAASSAWDPIWKSIMEALVWIFDWLGISVFLGFSII